MIFTEKYQKLDFVEFGDAFVGANTHSGFVGMYDELLNEETMKRVYVIKGAPGTGKSTLLKKIYKTATERNISAERFACSSDPFSLDLVILNSDVAILDGTAPHTYDMKYPGASSSIVDLSVFWDPGELEKFKSEIIMYTDHKRKLYADAYSKLKILNMLFSERRQIINSLIDSNKLCKFISKFVKEFSMADENKSVTYAYHRCISTAGRFRLNTLEKNAEMVFKIEDYYGSAYIFTEKLAVELQRCGVQYIASIDPLDPAIISEIYLPTSQVLITIDDTEYVYKYINMKRFVFKDQLEYLKGELKLSKKCSEAVNAEVLKYMNEAGETHKKLESIYSEYIDFQALSDYSENLLGEIIRNLS